MAKLGIKQVHIVHTCTHYQLLTRCVACASVTEGPEINVQRF